MCNKVYELLFFDVDLPKSAENTSSYCHSANSGGRMHSSFPYCNSSHCDSDLLCIKKKSKRKILDLQECTYDSVSPPPSVYTTSLSKSTKFADCESDDTKQKTSDFKVELTENVAYGSFKPLSTADATPNSASTTADL